MLVGSIARDKRVDSLCCTPETDVALPVNYTQIKNEKTSEVGQA